jgi:hypothetical protein
MRAIGLLAIAMCVACPKPALAQEVVFTAEERQQGEAIIKTAGDHFVASLRDAPSAIFKNVFIGKRPNQQPGSKVVVCGQVNGRNAYGGYTGFQTFIASEKEVHVGKVIGLDVAKVCANDRVFDTRDYSAELRAALEAPTN